MFDSPFIDPFPIHSRLWVGVLSTFPPQLCGLATFAEALSTGLEGAGNRVLRVAVNDGHSPPAHADAWLANNQRGAPLEIAEVLSQCDVVIIQHEYGIFGGEDGDEILEVLDALTVPSIVVLHTVPVNPTQHQRMVLEEVCSRASSVIVMARAAGERLVDGYEVDASRLTMIPHGATLPARTGRSDNVDHRFRLLTWGLLGPGKGIEHAISAIALLNDIRPRIQYTIAGATHPNVFARQGNSYRIGLGQLADQLGIQDQIVFDETYRDVPTLMRFVSSSSAVVLPYDSREQVTSGVLVDALAAGRPVIATAFPHAIELLSDGAGIVVPHGDPNALAMAIRSLVNDPDRLEFMSERAAAIAPTLSWTSVAQRYIAICDDLVRVSVSKAS
jgi:glycosyltransferase involved in cell wall biosynthesis